MRSFRGAAREANAFMTKSLTQGREHHFQDSQGHNPLADAPRCRLRKPATTEADRQGSG